MPQSQLHLGADLTTTTVLAVGDLILEQPNPDALLEPMHPVLRSGDVVIGHVETPFTNEGVVSTPGFAAPGSNPEYLSALPRAGFNVATLAGNHIFDQGLPGVRDTVQTLRALGIATAGAGLNFAEAIAPAVVNHRGRSVAVLSYNTVGPRESWAGTSKAGCAYVRTLTHYDLQFANPGGAPKVYTFCDPDDLDALCVQVERARNGHDIVVVALHKGAVGVTMSWYEKQITRAVIEAGADVVLGHHPHSLRGVEIYRGRPIYHGLGNFAVATRAFSGNASSLENERTKSYYRVGASQDSSYPFSAETRYSMVARCLIDDSGAIEVRFVPCYIDGPTLAVTRDSGGEDVLAFVRRMSEGARLASTYTWDGDEIVVAHA